MKQDDADRIICRCEEITLREIETAVDEGFTTLNEVKRRTRAGMGLCQSRSCSRLIAQIISRKTGLSMSEIMPVTPRPPTRPVKLDVFSEGDQDGTDC